MNANTNKVWLIGNIEAFKFSKFDNQLSSAEFYLQTKTSFYEPSGIKTTQLLKHPCRIFGKQAEQLERFTKDGTELAVEGVLVNNSTKNKPAETYVQINDLLILNKR